MIQNEARLKKYQEVMTFTGTNHRNSSHHNLEERGQYLNWMKQNRKLLNAGKMKEDRVELFLKLLEVRDEYKLVNQYR